LGYALVLYLLKTMTKDVAIATIATVTIIATATIINSDLGATTAGVDVVGVDGSAVPKPSLIK